MAIVTVMEGQESFAEGLGAIIDALGAGLEGSGFRDGCPIATVTLEAAAKTESIRSAAAEAFGGWLTALEDRLLAEGMDRAAAERRALLALSAIEGALCWRGHGETSDRCWRSSRSCSS